MLGDRQITANFVKYRLTISLIETSARVGDKSNQATYAHIDDLIVGVSIYGIFCSLSNKLWLFKTESYSEMTGKE